MMDEILQYVTTASRRTIRASSVAGTRDLMARVDPHCHAADRVLLAVHGNPVKCLTS